MSLQFIGSTVRLLVLPQGAVIDPLLMDGYSTISLGYIGLYEVTKLMTGVSHVHPDGEAFAVKVMKRLEEATKLWKQKTGHWIWFIWKSG